MGVRGLKSFLKNFDLHQRIKIPHEIQQWKSRHPNQRPVIVVDFCSLTYPMIKQYHKEGVCGGRHQMLLTAWKQLLDALKATGSSLVFVSDLNIPKTNFNKLIQRQNEQFDVATKLYNAIGNGKKGPIKVAKKTPKSILQSATHGLAVTAQSYGPFYYALRHEADVEIAHYANQHNAMAIISDDSDFLIFNGSWRLWSATEVVRSKSRLRAIEYNRKSIERTLSLSTNQLPLFAILVGNDVTNSTPLALELDNFFENIDPSQPRIQNVAKFIQRDLSHGINFARFSDNDIRQIIAKIFGCENHAWEQLIKSGIDWYNANYAPFTTTDAIEAKLAQPAMYRPYMKNMSRTQMIAMSYYDLGGGEPNTSLPGLLIDWMKHRTGILMEGTKNPTNTFTVLAKKSVNEKWLAHEETITLPNFSVPNLDLLYSQSNDAKSLKSHQEARWKLLGWIMSFSDEIIKAIKELPKEFILICATLCALVQNRLISIEAAGGILYTEYACRTIKASAGAGYPKVIEAVNIRAAHIYNIGFGAVRENFAIAGLLPMIEQILQFDGVFFQKHMEQMAGLNVERRDALLSTIQNYRIHANIEQKV